MDAARVSGYVQNFRAYGRGALCIYGCGGVRLRAWGCVSAGVGG